MMEHSIYSVISPEAGASILWRDAARAKDVALAMKITAQDLLQFGIVDGIIDEPVGGAHRGMGEVIEATGNTIRTALEELTPMSAGDLRSNRRAKFLAIGRNLE